ncbi:hypothetical protein A4G28_04550 [Mycobacterium ostraviense]|uniref:DUF2746 domain-containing protein n=1 Tax=Mycobacterium ostraviense TaxID=2738409 RepID=A0A164B4E8_9MYCO|nr:hypothetical protein A4G28_04550 [Mycobacterium ostraviense]
MASILIVNGFIWLQSRRTGKKMTAVQDQVTNGGSTNLAATVEEIRRMLDGQGHDVRSLRNDIGGLRVEVRDIEHRVRRIEQQGPESRV